MGLDHVKAWIGSTCRLRSLQVVPTWRTSSQPHGLDAQRRPLRKSLAQKNRKIGVKRCPKEASGLTEGVSEQPLCPCAVLAWISPTALGQLRFKQKSIRVDHFYHPPCLHLELTRKLRACLSTKGSNVGVSHFHCIAHLLALHNHEMSKINESANFRVFNTSTQGSTSLPTLQFLTAS